MNLNDFLLKTYIHDEKYQVRPAIVCKDGLTLSVQGSYGHWSIPRENNYEFEKVEVGYPSQAVPALLEYAEDKKKPTKTVYPFVPVSVVQQVINEHGGIDESKTFRKL